MLQSSKTPGCLAAAIACALTLTSITSVVHATERDHSDSEPDSLRFDGSLLRLRLGAQRTPLPGFGEQSDEVADTLYSRMRLRFDYRSSYQIAVDEVCCVVIDRSPPRLRITVEADVLSGVLLGDVAPNIPGRADLGSQLRRNAWDAPYPGAAFDPRAAYVGYKTPIGLLQLGLQGSDFGLGVLANSGDESNEKLAFDRRQGGDRVWRALFVTKPFYALGSVYEHIHLAVGADIVWRDDNADWLRGDRAYQLISSLFYRQEGLFVGGYLARRRQRDLEGSRLDVTALDASVSIPVFSHHDTLSGEIGAEVAMLRGSTDRVYPFEGGDSMDIKAMGAALEYWGYHTRTKLGLQILLGGASGDSNLDDPTLYRFRFDPNYNVGLIMFDHYLPAVTRAYYDRATDLTKVGEEPRGVDNLINDGAVENAYYLNPQLTLGDPVQGALIAAGAVIAWSPQPWSDPYSSVERGGQPVGLLGGTDSLEQLGWEVDVAAQYKTFLRDGRLALALRAEGGLLMPGTAFATAAGERPASQTLVRARFDFEW